MGELVALQGKRVSVKRGDNWGERGCELVQHGMAFDWALMKSDIHA